MALSPERDSLLISLPNSTPASTISFPVQIYPCITRYSIIALTATTLQVRVLGWVEQMSTAFSKFSSVRSVGDWFFMRWLHQGEKNKVTDGWSRLVGIMVGGVCVCDCVVLVPTRTDSNLVQPKLSYVYMYIYSISYSVQIEFHARPKSKLVFRMMI